MKFTQEIVDKISDELQHTYCFQDENTIVNTLFPEELDGIEKAIKRYLGDVHVTFHKLGWFNYDSGYDGYEIKVSE